MPIRIYFIWTLFVGVNILWASPVRIDSVKTYTLKASKKVQGTIERLHKFPSKYITPRHVDVWMPENYNPKKRYTWDRSILGANHKRIQITFYNLIKNI
jgi:hypothetical protein